MASQVNGPSVVAQLAASVDAITAVRQAAQDVAKQIYAERAQAQAQAPAEGVQK